ncbi:caspase family protein [Cupriavidus necator]|uniref:caspase family protein n=1 Tax=Cupriavidus necator TaxID=106590 RepID=UPI00339D4897
MVSRKALIIGSPDEKIPGVKVDVENLKRFFMSPVGGLWYESEITTLITPSASDIRAEIEILKRKDYSLIFFAGHGYHSNQRGSTILHINSRETINSLELRVGAEKHTLILDCCRKREDEKRVLKAAMESMTFDSARGQALTPAECRRYFEQDISRCDGGIVVMNSCAIDETAGESESAGGYYTSSLIGSANEWAGKRLSNIDLTKLYATFSTQESHHAASARVKLLSGGRQTPAFEAPRAEKKFPFAVVA